MVAVIGWFLTWRAVEVSLWRLAGAADEPDLVESEACCLERTAAATFDESPQSLALSLDWNNKVLTEYGEDHPLPVTHTSYRLPTTPPPPPGWIRPSWRATRAGICACGAVHPPSLCATSSGRPTRWRPGSRPTTTGTRTSSTQAHFRPPPPTSARPSPRTTGLTPVNRERRLHVEAVGSAGRHRLTHFHQAVLSLLSRAGALLTTFHTCAQARHGGHDSAIASSS